VEGENLQELVEKQAEIINLDTLLTKVMGAPTVRHMLQALFS
jgi:hypothetical protein